MAAFAAGVGALAVVWLAWCEFVFQSWNDVRLAPAFALRHGINPYPPLGGGPVFTWIYGPVGILLNLPATFASTAIGALHLASVINAIVVIGPMALIFFRMPELRRRGLTICLLATALTVLLLPKASLTFQVADHAAIAFGLLSCLVLTLVEQPAPRHLLLAAAFCALAVWSKQTALFLLPAQLVYLSRGKRWTVVVRYLAGVAGFGALGGLSFAAYFGPANLWLNLVSIPGRLPAAELGSQALQRAWPLLGQVVVPGLVVMGIWRSGRWPDRTTASGRFFQLGMLAAATMLPVGLAALLKIGGDSNSVHSWAYLLPALLLFWLTRENLAATPALVRVLCVLTLALGLRAKEFANLPTRPYADHYALAGKIVQPEPDRYWFPQNPVLGFYCSGTLWHSEDGMITRYAAGFGLEATDLHAHFPPRLRGIVYPSSTVVHFAAPLVPEFNQTVNVRFWKILVR